MNRFIHIAYTISFLQKICFYVCVFFFFSINTSWGQDPSEIPLFYPFAEWEIEYSAYSGNPYDIVATVVFTHTGTNEQITTEMFYDGDWDWESQTKGTENLFKFRFSGSILGEWTYTTSSSENTLDGLTGSINVVDQPDENLARGFVQQLEGTQKWGWSGNNQAFIPNLIMAGEGTEFYYNNPSAINSDITEFIGEHGMAGFHYSIFFSWFGLNNGRHTSFTGSDSQHLSPSIESFELIETLIKELYEAGAMVHLWEWGDDARDQSPVHLSGGINGLVHQRLQRYISARLGAIPGWTLGTGFDLHEQWTGTELENWNSYYKSKLGWNHVIGARGHFNDSPVDQVMTDQLDYMGHEDHATINYDGNIAYDRFIDWLNEYPDKLHFSEDRFRDRNHGTPSKPFGEKRMRQTLWHTAMVGGVAAIYGRADSEEGDSPITGIWNGSDNRSFSLTNKNEFKIFGDFWKDRFAVDLERDNSITDGYALRVPSNDYFIIYKEETASIEINLSGVTVNTAIAVDTKAASYNEIDISSTLSSNSQNTWTAPSSSDWAISINGSSDGSGGSPPAGPPSINEINTTGTTASVSYSEVSDADSYEYRLDGGSSVNIGTANPFEIDGLSTGTSYDLQMRSINSDGTSDWSEITSFTTEAGEQPPNSPPTIQEVTTAETTATVSYDGVGDAESYEYRLDGGSPVNIGTVNPFEIDGLSTGTSYDLQMRSINSDGTSDWSETATFTTVAGEQPPVSAPTIDDVTVTQTTATVSYSEVTNAESYEYRLDGGTPVNIGTTNPFQIEDLSAGTSYDLQMRSVNSDGTSDWSETATFTTEAGVQPPNSPPAIQEVIPTETTAAVSYDEVGDAESYEYRLDAGSSVNIGTTNPFEIEDLSPGTSYDLQMRSVNSEGTSDWSSITAFTTRSDEADAPDEVVLMQNYPNPFNPSTTIRYGIPEESHVLLEIFDMLGKKIAVLVNEQKTEGYYEVVFNADNLSSGTYLYRIQSEKQVKTQKLLLVK